MDIPCHRSQALVDTTKVNMPHKRQPQDAEIHCWLSEMVEKHGKTGFLAHSGNSELNIMVVTTQQKMGAKLNSFRNLLMIPASNSAITAAGEMGFTPRGPKLVTNQWI